jgi:hypothetical protein
VFLVLEDMPEDLLSEEEREAELVEEGVVVV